MSVFEPVLANTLRVFESYGLDAEAVFAEEDIRLRLPLDPSVRVSWKKYLQVRRRAAELSNDPYFSLRTAQVYHPGDLGVLGFAWLASYSLRECFVRLERYIEMAVSGAEILVNDEPPNLIVSYATNPGMEPDLLTSISPGATILQMSRDHRKKPFKLTEMKFACNKPTRIAGFHKFFDCPLSFGHEFNQLIIPLEVADEPIPHANRQLAKLNDQIMDRYLTKSRREDLTGRVRVEIIRQLPTGRVTRDSVAARLQYSSRTLHRRLKDENSSYKQLMTQARKELVKQYMSDRSLSLSEIAFMLGFSELSAFSRAYKGWFGQSPRAVRNIL